VTVGGEVTIEQILQEKKTFDVSLNFEKLGLGDSDRGWQNPGEMSQILFYLTELIPTAPSKATVLSTLPTRSNILSVHLLSLILSPLASPRICIVATTADRWVISHIYHPYLLIKGQTTERDRPA
jgi:hypothetical protein